MSILKELRQTEENKKKGKMVSISVPHDIASFLSKKFLEIKGDDVDPLDMHITLGLIRDEDDKDEKILNAISRAVSEIDPFRIAISSFDFFTPSESSNNNYVLIAKPESNLINGLHDKIFNSFKDDGLSIDNGSFKFSPHITIKYCKNKPLIKNKNLHNTISFTTDKVSFVNKGNKKNVFLRNKE